MTIIYIAVPIAVLLAVAFVCSFIWAVKNGQLDDLDSPPIRILTDDE